jgi:hypothetical protein
MVRIAFIVMMTKAEAVPRLEPPGLSMEPLVFASNLNRRLNCRVLWDRHKSSFVIWATLQPANVPL